VEVTSLTGVPGTAQRSCILNAGHLWPAHPSIDYSEAPLICATRSLRWSGISFALFHAWAQYTPRKDCNMKRYGSLIGVRPEALDEYKRYHAAAWPEVLAMIRKCNIRNYSIFLKDGLLFGYFEYHGTDYAADMAKMAADPKTQEWWAIMMPMQRPLETRAKGEWWASMEEVFHVD
jgi:L-rhamnose mutarotase